MKRPLPWKRVSSSVCILPLDTGKNAAFALQVLRGGWEILINHGIVGNFYQQTTFFFSFWGVNFSIKRYSYTEAGENLVIKCFVWRCFTFRRCRRYFIDHLTTDWDEDLCPYVLLVLLAIEGAMRYGWCNYENQSRGIWHVFCQICREFYWWYPQRVLTNVAL